MAIDVSPLSVDELEALRDEIQFELKHKRGNPHFEPDSNILELMKRADYYRKLGWALPLEVVVEESAGLMDLSEEEELRSEES